MKIMLMLLFLAIYPSNQTDDISLTFQGEKVKVINRSEYALPPFDKSMINQKKYNQLIESLETEIYKEPINASFDKNGSLISEQMGHALNREKFREVFYTKFYKNGATSMEIPIKTLYPKVDSELLASISTKRISLYITYFNSRNKERTHNIFLASEAINNFVVFPGETFSFNNVVGKRTIEKGYLSAPIIVKGELAEGVGGGICQVSSTLFNAVDKAGVKIIERYSHSRRVPYVPPNRDATVSWYGPDFTFQNRHTQPLLIRSKVVGGQLIIVILSSDTFEHYKREVPSAPHELPKEIHTSGDNF